MKPAKGAPTAEEHLRLRLEAALSGLRVALQHGDHNYSKCRIGEHPDACSCWKSLARTYLAVAEAK